MRKIKIRAGLFLTATALYIWGAALLNLLEIYVPAGLALIVGLFCGRACMQCGVDMERWRRVQLAVKEKEMERVVTGAVKQHCGTCGYEGFRIAAGRLVCNCCGEVFRDVQE